MKSYVYAFILESEKSVYIGKSNSPDFRRKTHGYNTKYLSNQSHFARAVRKYKFENFEFKVLEEFESEDEAYLGEEKHVAIFKCEGYKMLNMNGGGRGCKSPTDETRKRMSDGQKKGYADNPERQVQISERNKKRYENQSARQKTSESGKRFFTSLSSDEREKEQKRRSDAMCAVWKQDKEKRMATLLPVLSSPERRKRVSDGNKKRFTDPVQRKLISETQLEAHRNMSEEKKKSRNKKISIKARKSRHRAKLTKDEVVEIRNEFNFRGNPINRTKEFTKFLSDMEKKYPVKRGTIRGIIKFEIWIDDD